MTETIDKVVESLEKGESVLLHGPGGTGKSWTIQHVAIALTQQGFKIACTATTGKAAISLNVPEFNIMASTLHSWAGVGLAKSSPLKLAAKIKTSKKYFKRWTEIDVLVIDEISMLGAEFFSKLDFIAKYVRENKSPFGGITLLLSGDFLQLPPVKDRWVFEGSEWNELKFKTFPMLIPKRYEDIKWFETLNRIRKGQFTKDDISILQKRERAYHKLQSIIENEDSSEVIKPTILFSKKVDVEGYNEDELQKLEHPDVIFVAIDSFIPKKPGTLLEEYLPQLDDAVSNLIMLKVGAQVMLCVNLDVGEGLVNGSRGVITEINETLNKEYSHTVKVRFLNGMLVTISPNVWEIVDKKGKASRTQIPLVLAWAITIHRVQGTTLDYAVVDCGPSVFTYGQAYVALSRVRSIKGLFLSEFYIGSLKTNRHALRYVNGIEQISQTSDTYELSVKVKTSKKKKTKTKKNN